MSGIRSAVPGPISSPPDLMLRLWPRPASCRDARRAVRAYCVECTIESLADDAELLTSELVTNAIAHTGTMITLVAACTNGQLVVSVRDDDIGGRNLVAAAAEATAESGRGLELVATIAGTWGMTPHADGKSVWFRLP